MTSLLIFSVLLSQEAPLIEQENSETSVPTESSLQQWDNNNNSAPANWPLTILA